MNRQASARKTLTEEGITPELFRTEPDNRMELTARSRKTLQQLSRRSGRSGALSPLGYNLTISHEKRFVWFRVAKVGTRTILGHLVRNEVPLDVHHAMRMRYPTSLFADYFKFAFVRHPIGRFTSAWRNKVVDHNYFGFDEATLARMQRVESFAAWAAEQDLSDLGSADHHLALQSRLIDLTQVDHVGRLETFDADFAAVCRRVGLPASPPEPLNQTAPSGADRQTASDELRSIIEEAYRRDYQIFGY